MTNADVVSMVRAGISADIIVQKIQQSPVALDVSAGELVRLKGLGVPDAVLKAMLDASKRSSDLANPASTSLRTPEPMHSEVWVDPDTGLMWDRVDHHSSVTWSVASGFCALVKSGGYFDWRPPTINELEGIQERNPSQPKDTNFVQMKEGIPGSVESFADTVWSSTPAERPGSVYTFGFTLKNNGRAVASEDGDQGRPLCVRNQGRSNAVNVSSDPIQREIERIRNGPHEAIPPAQTSGMALGGETSITVENRTAYVLSIYLSGPVSQKLEIAAGASESLRLSPGNYDIAARVSNASVVPFYGQQNYGANTQYSEHFYIASTVR